MPITKYSAFIQWLPCACGVRRYGIVRLFPEPLAEIEDGMPKGGWVWMCVFEQLGAVVTIYGAKEAPPNGGLRPLLQKAKELGGERLRWDRSKPEGLRVKEFSL